MRGALSGLPHLGAGWLVLGVGVALTVSVAFGLRGFVRRAVD